MGDASFQCSAQNCGFLNRTRHRVDSSWILVNIMFILSYMAAAVHHARAWPANPMCIIVIRTAQKRFIVMVYRTKAVHHTVCRIDTGGARLESLVTRSRRSTAVVRAKHF